VVQINSKRRGKMKKTMLIVLAVALAIPLTFVMAFGGNGAPNGPH